MVICIKWLIFNSRHFRFIWIILLIKIAANDFCRKLQWYIISWYQSRTSWRWKFSNFSKSGLSVASAFFLFGLETTEVFCVWDWDLITTSSSVTADRFEGFSSILWSLGLFAGVARFVILGTNSSRERPLVVIWSKLRYFTGTFPSLIKNGNNSCSVKLFEKFSKLVWT